MLQPHNLEGSTMVANKGINQKVSTMDHERVGWSRVPNCDNMDNL